MRILRREVVWIHTHFVTDCVYLPAHYAREVEDKMGRVLEEQRIVFGIHFDSRSDEEGLRIVLECVPLPGPMRQIEAALVEIVKPMPARPRRTQVQVEPPPFARATGGRPAKRAAAEGR
jgi:hypothetical protein